MNPRQNVDIWRETIRNRFVEFKAAHPEALERRLDLSWSNWGFGLEPLEVSCRRLADAGLSYIELAGNHLGADLGYRVPETLRILDDHGLKVSGICGLFSPDNDLSSNVASQRQAGIDYLKREVDFAHQVGGGYLLVVPGAVGRPVPYDGSEFARSVSSLQQVAERFEQAGIKGAIEPIRAAEVSVVHTIDDALSYIEAVGSPGIQHVNGDVFHIQSEERFIPASILKAGDRLINLHLADSNRMALGDGSMDIDSIIMALYLLGHNRPGRFATCEPLGPGGDSYLAMYSMPDPARLDKMVNDTIGYFRAREEAVLAL